MGSLVEIILAIVLVGVGVFVLSILSALIGLLPAIVAAIIIYVVTGSLLWAGIAFVVVAFLWSLVRKH